jgi:hypothetical protein
MSGILSIYRKMHPCLFHALLFVVHVSSVGFLYVWCDKRLLITTMFVWIGCPEFDFEWDDRMMEWTLLSK